MSAPTPTPPLVLIVSAISLFPFTSSRLCCLAASFWLCYTYIGPRMPLPAPCSTIITPARPRCKSEEYPWACNLCRAFIICRAQVESASVVRLCLGVCVECDKQDPHAGDVGNVNGVSSVSTEKTVVGPKMLA